MSFERLLQGFARLYSQPSYLIQVPGPFLNAVELLVIHNRPVYTVQFDSHPVPVLMFDMTA